MPRRKYEDHFDNMDDLFKRLENEIDSFDIGGEIKDIDETVRNIRATNFDEPGGFEAIRSFRTKSPLRAIKTILLMSVVGLIIFTVLLLYTIVTIEDKDETRFEPPPLTEMADDPAIDITDDELGEKL